MIFVAVTAFVYFLAPKNYRWIVLLTASYVFYWINSGWLLLILFTTTAFTYLVGNKIHRINQNSNKKPKALLLFGVLVPPHVHAPFGRMSLL